MGFTLHLKIQATLKAQVMRMSAGHAHELNADWHLGTYAEKLLLDRGDNPTQPPNQWYLLKLSLSMVKNYTLINKTKCMSASHFYVFFFDSP